MWAGCDAGDNITCSGDYEIYLWDGATITQITDNSTKDYGPTISGSNVVWFGQDGDDWEIYLWDGVTITQITDNSADDFDPVISGSNVVWWGYDGDDWEIYMTTISNPVPSISPAGVALLAGLVLGTAALLIQRRRGASA